MECKRLSDVDTISGVCFLKSQVCFVSPLLNVATIMCGENENYLVHLIKGGSFIRLKRVRGMMPFIIRVVLFCNGALKQDIFPRFFMVIHLKGQYLLLRKTLLHCKDYNFLWLLQNEWTQINYWKFSFFYYFYQLDLVLT